MNSDSPAQPPLFVVVGPTASGKTAFSLDLAEALGGEIISADSVQVYRYFDIGASKPSAEEQRRVRHHLLDVQDPHDTLDAARWADAAAVAIADIQSRGKVPILCGGSFLWVRALLFGLAAAPPANPEIRERHQQLAERAGRKALHAELRARDPEAARRLSENDFVRVSRALEVFELTGTPLSQIQMHHGFKKPRYPARLLGLRRSPAELDARIHLRTRTMLEAGLVEEVRELIERGYAPTRAMASVGYRQVLEALTRGGMTDEELCTAIYRKTRVFARRQRTWLRDQPVEWLAPGNLIAELLRQPPLGTGSEL